MFKFEARDGKPLGIYRLPYGHSPNQIAVDRAGLKAFVTTSSYPWGDPDSQKILILDTRSVK